MVRAARQLGAALWWSPTRHRGQTRDQRQLPCPPGGPKLRRNRVPILGWADSVSVWCNGAISINQPYCHLKEPTVKGLTARVDSPWVSYTPLAEHTLTVARQVAFGASGPYAAAAVGVYGSGKSTLLFALLRDALAQGHLPVWEEAAAFVARLLPGAEPVLPQQFVERVCAWLQQIATDSTARQAYFADLERRGRGDVAAKLGSVQPSADAIVVLLLDEVEQAHQLLLRRVATDDGQPLRALLDACGPRLRLVLAYAPESFHTLGDADRGRMVTLPVPPIDVSAIQTTFRLDRGHANFAWWASRGRARGVEQAVRGVLEPLRAGLFDSDLTALGAAVDALPGVFGVPALVRDGLDHRRLRALLHLHPEPCPPIAGGVVCRLGDRVGLADRIRHELARRLGPVSELEPVANEVVAVLEAVADHDGCAYLTFDDFAAALRVAEARVVESGRIREPIVRLAEEGARIFDTLGELGPLHHRLPFSVRELSDELFPSPFTDPYLPVGGGAVPTEAELERNFRAVAAAPGPVLVCATGGYAVFADADGLTRAVQAATLDTAAEPLRALLLDGSRPLSAVLELAQCAGRLAIAEVGRFHATFLKCLTLRARAAGFGTDMDALLADSRTDRQLGRKMAWHRDRVAVLARDLRPRPAADWQAAAGYIRQNESFRGTLARLDRESPALLGLLFALRPVGPAERAVCARAAALLAEGSPLRRLAREANPGGRMSGAAVVIDGLLPTGGRPPRWIEQAVPGSREIARVVERFAVHPGLRPQLAAWLYAEDRARLETLLQYHAGQLPDVHRELDALDALRRLDETSLRAAAVVADLQRCTGRPQAALTALKLGTFTDQVRVQAGPVEQLRQLAADVQALAATGSTAWVRALALWLCGVIAARLLKGAEKEQAALADWERLAASGADVGRHADELQAALTGVGALRCVELLRHRRAQLANQLDAAATAAHGVESLRAAVAALAPLVQALEQARDALRDHGIAIDDAVEAYLPDPDDAGAHRALLRRVPELLAELGGQAPRPAGRGLLAYLELLRRHAEGSRHNRLRLQLEELLGTTLDAELPLHADEVAAIEAAWAAIPEPTRLKLLAEIRSADVRGSADLQRWIVGCADKLVLVVSWPDPGHRLLDRVDEQVALWTTGIAVTAEDVREATRNRAKALARVHDLGSGQVAEAVLVDLIASAAAVADGRVYAAIVAAARDLDERLGALRERYSKIAGAFAPGPLVADTAANAIAAMEALCVAKRDELDLCLAQLRRIGVMLAELGEKMAPVPAELSLIGATRMADQQADRLRDRLGQVHRALAAWMAAEALPAGLLPDPVADLQQWWDELRLVKQHADQLQGRLQTAQTLGIAPVAVDSADWVAIGAALDTRLAAAHDELHALQRQQAELVERSGRLGAPASAQPEHPPTLAAARLHVAALADGVVRLRQDRLAAASGGARRVYAAILAGDGTELPPAVAELVALGLLRTVEDAP